MLIRLLSILVNDQARALEFYTNKLGFSKRSDIPMGDHRWITLASEDEEEECVELVLEPLAFEPARTYQQALYDAGIPFTAFQVKDIAREFRKLQEKDVIFSMEPTNMGEVTLAVFDDTCGNHIQIYQA